MTCVSVVIPFFNRMSFIQRALDCIYQQTALQKDLCRIEIIIVDDGSEVTQAEALDHLTKGKSEIILIRLEVNQGPSSARNRGIENASGDYIAFLDTDDLWPREKLELLLPVLIDNPEVQITGGRVKFEIKDGVKYSSKADLSRLHQADHVNLGALLVRKKFLLSGFLFDERLRYGEDVSWWLHVMDAKTEVLLIEEYCLIYYIHGGNMVMELDKTRIGLFKALHDFSKKRKSLLLPEIPDFRIGREIPFIDIFLSSSIMIQESSSIDFDRLTKSINAKCNIWKIDRANNKILCETNSYRAELEEIPFDGFNDLIETCTNKSFGELIVFSANPKICEGSFIQDMWKFVRSKPYTFWFVAKKTNTGKDISITSFQTVVFRKRLLKYAISNKLGTESHSFEDYVQNLADLDIQGERLSVN